MSRRGLDGDVAGQIRCSWDYIDFSKEQTVSRGATG